MHCNTCMVICGKVIAFAGCRTQNDTPQWRLMKEVDVKHDLGIRLNGGRGHNQGKEGRTDGRNDGRMDGQPWNIMFRWSYRVRHKNHFKYLLHTYFITIHLFKHSTFILPQNVITHWRKFRCQKYNYGKSTRNDSFYYDWLEQLVNKIHLTITNKMWPIDIKCGQLGNNCQMYTDEYDGPQWTLCLYIKLHQYLKYVKIDPAEQSNWNTIMWCRLSNI